MSERRLQVWPRYRLPLALSVPTGAVLGALIGVAFYYSSNSETRAADRALGWISYTVTLSAGVGAVTAVIAAAGAIANVLLHTRLSPSKGSVSLGQVAVGAGCSVAATCSALGAVIALTTGTGWAAASGWVTTGVLLGLLSGIAAALTTALAPRLGRKRPVVQPCVSTDRQQRPHSPE